MDILSNFSENISELINDKKITIEQFAKDVDLDLSEVYRYQRKEYLPQLVNIVKIADTYNYSVDYLIGKSPFPEGVKFKTTPPFSVRLKELLTERNITRYRISKSTKISINRLDDWYNGKYYPSLDKAIELARYFNCTIDFLLGREP